MAIYHLCSQALKSLMEDPPTDLPFYQENPGVFTEIDIVNRAQNLARAEWGSDPAIFRQAMRNANQVAGTFWREMKVARYGPVELPDRSQDYARAASKIVYAHPELGPEWLKTPNGTFKRMMVWEDTIGRQGRKIGTNRDDTKPWDEQEITKTKAVTEVAKPDKAKADLKAAQRRIEQLEAENRRVHEQAQRVGADGASPDLEAVIEMIGEMENRLQAIEAFVNQIRGAVSSAA